VAPPQPQTQTAVHGQFDAGARFTPGRSVNVPVSEINSIHIMYGSLCQLGKSCRWLLMPYVLHLMKETEGTQLICLAT